MTPLKKDLQRFEEDPQLQAIIGIDEVGRGPLCGPLMACGVIITRESIQNIPPETADSKTTKESVREELYEKFIQMGLPFIVHAYQPIEIDRLGVGKANTQSFIECKKIMETQSPGKVLILADGTLKIPGALSIKKGESQSAAIAAASIIAKVTRDREMVHLDKEFPHYGWQKNKGYGTKSHIQAILKHGACIHHRESFLKIDKWEASQKYG
jgi:ribonuclease HII